MTYCWFENKKQKDYNDFHPLKKNTITYKNKSNDNRSSELISGHKTDF